MGLLQAGIGALSGVLADQWREYFYCDSMPENVLMTKGVKRTGSRNANTKGEDNIITNGSIIAVNEGQCMMIVEQGAIVEFSAQAGEFVWDNSTEPSIFYGNLGDNLKSTWEILKKRFTFGANPAKDQRIYYFNTKEIIGNKYGTANPVPFRVVYNNIGAGLELEVSVKCFGEYSYKITNPMLFYKNVCSNVTDSYTRDRIDSQMRSEMMTALQPAFARISDMGIKYSSLPGHTTELAQCLNEELSAKWRDLRGIEMFPLASAPSRPATRTSSASKNCSRAQPSGIPLWRLHIWQALRARQCRMLPKTRVQAHSQPSPASTWLRAWAATLATCSRWVSSNSSISSPFSSPFSRRPLRPPQPTAGSASAAR